MERQFVALFLYHVVYVESPNPNPTPQQTKKFEVVFKVGIGIYVTIEILVGTSYRSQFG